MVAGWLALRVTERPAMPTSRLCLTVRPREHAVTTTCTCRRCNTCCHRNERDNTEQFYDEFGGVSFHVSPPSAPENELSVRHPTMDTVNKRFAKEKKLRVMEIVDSVIQPVKSTPSKPLVFATYTPVKVLKQAVVSICLNEG